MIIVTMRSTKASHGHKESAMSNIKGGSLPYPRRWVRTTETTIRSSKQSEASRVCLAACSHTTQRLFGGTDVQTHPSLLHLL